MRSNIIYIIIYPKHTPTRTPSGLLSLPMSDRYHHEVYRKRNLIVVEIWTLEVLWGWTKVILGLFSPGFDIPLPPKPHGINTSNIILQYPIISTITSSQLGREKDQIQQGFGRVEKLTILVQKWSLFPPQHQTINKTSTTPPTPLPTPPTPTPTPIQPHHIYHIDLNLIKGLF